MGILKKIISCVTVNASIDFLNYRFYTAKKAVNDFYTEVVLENFTHGRDAYVADKTNT